MPGPSPPPLSLDDVCEYTVAFPKSLRTTHHGSRVEAEMPPRVQRLARLMALAIRFDRLIADGTVRDYAHIAALGHVTRARVTQIMNLRFLAPDIQEGILLLPEIANEEADTLIERDLRELVAKHDWRQQRRLWRELTRPTHQT